MPSGFKVNGIDLDDIFKLRSTSATANVNFKNNTQDLADRYEKIAYSPQQEISYNTGFKAGGSPYSNTDLRYIFVDKNYV